MSRRLILITILLSTIHPITFSHAFNHSTVIQSRWRRPDITGERQREHVTHQHRPRATTSQLRLARRKATPTKNNSRKKKKRRSLEELLELEIDLRDRGYRYVVGSDDSGGAGCLAGPVVVASCCLLKPHSSFLPTIASSSSSSPAAAPEEEEEESSSSTLSFSPSEAEALSEVYDCKELTPARREEIYDIVMSRPDAFAVSVAQRSPRQIDEINLTRATQEAFAESIETLVDGRDLPFGEVYAIVDGKVSPKLYASRRKQCDSPEEAEEEAQKLFSVRPYVNGDANVYTVALASIVARVARDAMVQELDEQYPLYGFSNHSGYGRRDHIEAIHRLGSIESVHRMSFKQVKGR